jgi:hypothetical protein
MGFLGLGRQRDNGRAQAQDSEQAAPGMQERTDVDGVKYRDVGVLAQLDALGADLRTPRHSMYYCAMPHADAAQACAAELGEAGLEARVNPGPAADHDGVDHPWMVVAQIEDQALIPGFLRETIDLCEQVAARHGGAYDGWEASLTEAEGEDLAGSG